MTASACDASPALADPSPAPRGAASSGSRPTVAGRTAGPVGAATASARGRDRTPTADAIRPGRGQRDEHEPDRRIRRATVNLNFGTPGVQGRLDDDRPTNTSGDRDRPARAQHDRGPARRDDDHAGHGRRRGRPPDRQRPDDPSPARRDPRPPARRRPVRIALRGDPPQHDRPARTGCSPGRTASSRPIAGCRGSASRSPFDRPNHGDPFVTPASARASASRSSSDRRLVYATTGEQVGGERADEDLRGPQRPRLRVRRRARLPARSRRRSAASSSTSATGPGFPASASCRPRRRRFARGAARSAPYPYQTYDLAQTAGGYGMESPGLTWIPTGVGAATSPTSSPTRPATSGSTGSSATTRRASRSPTRPPPTSSPATSWACAARRAARRRDST